MRKNEAWLEHTTPQGVAFYALCHEAGGRMGDSAYDFLGMIIDSAGGSASDRVAFKVYALQRLHAANFRGVAAVISSRPVIRTGPGDIFEYLAVFAFYQSIQSSQSSVSSCREWKRCCAKAGTNQMTSWLPN